MHFRRITDIEKALHEGEEVRLYPMELSHARVHLQEVRANDAQYHLQKVLTSHDIEEIELAMEQAAQAGVNQKALQSADKALQHEKRRADVRTIVHMALRHGAISDLRAALSDGDKIGLEESELFRARAALASAEQKVTERERLEQATESFTEVAANSLSLPEPQKAFRKCAQVLQDAIETAGRAGLVAADLDPAKKLLETEVAKTEARFALKEARLGKKYEAWDRIEDLGAAVKQSKGARVPREVIVPAEQQLKTNQREALARKKLREAAELATVVALQNALEDAQEVGMDEDDLRQTRLLLDDAHKPAARLKLREAVQSRDVQACWAAIAEAQAVGLSSVACEDAQRVIREEELKKGASSRLVSALEQVPERGLGCLNELRAALNYAEVNRVDGDEIIDGREELQSLEQQKAAKEGLERVIASRGILELRDALAVCEDAVDMGSTVCIPSELIAEAEQALDEEVKSAARTALAEMLQAVEASNDKSGNVRKKDFVLGVLTAKLFKDAIEARSSPSKSAPSSRRPSITMEGPSSRRPSVSDLSPPKMGGRRMSRAGGFGSDGAAGRPGKDSVEGEEYRSRIEPMKRVIRGLEIVELDEHEIKPLKEALADVEKKLEASVSLTAARKIRSFTVMEEALEQARKAGLSHVEMKSTLDVQKAVQKLYEATERLEAALESDEDIEKLRWGIRYGEEAKMDQDELDDAMEVLQEWERKEAARERLRKIIAEAEQECGTDEEEAKTTRDVEVLSKALAELEETLNLDERPFYRDALEAAKRRAEEAGNKFGRKQKRMKARAETLITEALRGDASHKLRQAIEEAETWSPEYDKIPKARKALRNELKRDAAREQLKAALASDSISTVLEAMRDARFAGIENWELHSAEQHLKALRRRVTADLIRQSPTAE